VEPVRFIPCARRSGISIRSGYAQAHEADQAEVQRQHWWKIPRRFRFPWLKDSGEITEGIYARVITYVGKVVGGRRFPLRRLPCCRQAEIRPRAIHAPTWAMLVGEAVLRPCAAHASDRAIASFHLLI